MPTTPPQQDTAPPSDRTAQATNDADGDHRPAPAGESLWIRVGPASTGRTDGGRPMDASLEDIRSELRDLDLRVVPLAPGAPDDDDLQRVVDRYERLLDEEPRDGREPAPDARSPGDRGYRAGLLDRLRTVADRLRR